MDPTLRKYLLAEVPRYTSYPTAVEFHEGVGEQEYRDWLAATPPDERLSLYIHIPFCQQLCWYCGCHTTIVNDYERVARYMQTIRRELTLVKQAIPAHGGVSHVHFGGGTPTILSGKDFIAFMDDVRRQLPLRNDAEVAVEIDPRTLSREKAAALAEAGVTRASLGVQDLGPHIQAKINRIQPFYVVAQAVHWLREAGVNGINFDLMYGLPGQEVADVERTVELSASLAPDRVAVFGYAHVPWFKKHQGMIETGDLPGPVERFEQAEAAARALKVQGYIEIGFDHYAKPGDAMAVAAVNGTLRRNFQGYTTDRANVLIGLGASSISRCPQGYAQNAPRLDVYRRRVDAGNLPVTRGVAFTSEDLLRGEAIERLMCDLQLDVEALCRRHQAPVGALDDALEMLAPLAADGLVTLAGRYVRVSTVGRRLLRNVAACFDAYHRHSQQRHSWAV